MSSRLLAILISSWLPVLGVTLPVSGVHRANALVAGIVGTILAAFSLVDRRARAGAALVGAWVALSAFVLPTTMIEAVMTVSWGVLMFSWLIGPFSDEPQVTRVRLAGAAPLSPPTEPEVELPRAA